MVGGAAKLEELLVEETWLEALSGELRKPYALDLCRFVAHERLHAKVPVYPPPHLVFHALHYAVRVKIFLVPAPDSAAEITVEIEVKSLLNWV